MLQIRLLITYNKRTLAYRIVIKQSIEIFLIVLQRSLSNLFLPDIKVDINSLTLILSNNQADNNRPNNFFINQQQDTSKSLKPLLTSVKTKKAVPKKKNPIFCRLDSLSISLP